MSVTLVGTNSDEGGAVSNGVGFIIGGFHKAACVHDSQNQKYSRGK